MSSGDPSLKKLELKQEITQKNTSNNGQKSIGNKDIPNREQLVKNKNGLPIATKTQSSNGTNALVTATTGQMSSQKVVTVSTAEQQKNEYLKIKSDARNKVLQFYADAINELRNSFNESLHQLFFIQSGGNMVDYPSWKLRPTPHLVSYLTTQKLDDLKIAHLTNKPSSVKQSFTSSQSKSRRSSDASENMKDKAESPEHYGFVQGHLSHDEKHPKNRHHDSKAGINKNNDIKNVLQNNSNESRTSSNSGPDILGQVRHESETLQRISELRKNGLWSASRLPKVFEIPRKKSHHDYMLEEMQWLAADFSQERRWKRNMAKKVSRSIVKYHQDRLVLEKRKEREEIARLKRIASGISKDIKAFWSQIEKVACYKQQSRQEEQRRKALDLHLNFIVGQTEKYSSWLAEGMKESSVSSPASEYTELEGQRESSDHETDSDNNEEDEDYENELDALKKESEIPIEDLLETLPQNMLKRITGQQHSDSEEEEENESEEDEDDEEESSDDESSSTEEKEEEEEGDKEIERLGGKEDLEDDDGGEFVANEIESDDEETIQEEEDLCGKTDYTSELDDLQKEGELPIEELLKMYGQPSEKEESVMDEEDVKNEAIHKTDTENQGESPKDTQSPKGVGLTTSTELDNAAATAESLQPKGFTLSTTQVRTKIPFLLRGTLREYQHIGLDWLVTMYTKQLNGILADEMGLGKTIQTIALLAHLACDEGTWGPHLIVVPTSVMLNWEFEFKKWCPAFKILTYFGSQKERKQKRIGWSKPNAFHVCITSYKLVIQDHQAFRRRKWKYLILDEAQNIKNFKSQRWQMLLNFNSQRRLLLTGTPLQNSLMELWSLMHFLMPNIFQSHQDFKEWFSNPLTGMIEGTREYSESIIKRLHSVLRPFLLRRLKTEVELQMPKKFEHVIKCRLSKRQRYLYDEFMSRRKTKETLEAGNFLSVINILMQLRKVCNHPDLFELRPTVSPLITEAIKYSVPSMVCQALDYDPFKHIDITSWNLCLTLLEYQITAFQSYRTGQLKVEKKLIQELDSISTNADEKNLSKPTTSVANSHFNSLSNLSSTLNTNHSDFEEARNFLDAIKDSLSEPNSAMDSETSDMEIGTDNEKEQEETNGQPPAKKAKLETPDELPCRREYKKRILDDFIVEEGSIYSMATLKERAKQERIGRFDLLAALNERHCAATPIYGSDLIHAFTMTQCKNRMKFVGNLSYQTSRRGLADCLSEMIKSPTERVKQRKGVTERFSIYVYPVITYTRPPLIATGQISRTVRQCENLEVQLKTCIGESADFLSSINTHAFLQFPETRLVQYDCGKLQALDRLLRQMKAGKHRGLIFTQMTRMLDVLERFLNYHGYIYLRLDGATKVEQRQVLMERFNQDDKIFIFILSTRSGGIGVNLTGADTVIFYDSDWNPTMDAQAQDRCHRIGQTRDVHIYRLISQRTVEENILKKAHQKRMLGNIAIEGGNFTTAFFKQESVRDLFNTTEDKEEDEGAEESVVVTEKKEAAHVETSGTADHEKEKNEEMNTESVKEEAKMSSEQYEKILAETEESEDVQAANKAKLEQDSELSEFNENVPLDGSAPENSKVEEELMTLEAELKPIERLALRFMESTNSYQVEDEVEETEKMLEEKKKEWELNHLQSLKEAEERKHAEEEDDMLFTYVRDETYDQPCIDDKYGVVMPMWTPPTPPRDGEVELATNYDMLFLYEMDAVPGNHLPPTHYLKKGGMDLYAMKKNTDRTHYLSLFKKRRHRTSKPKSIFDKKALELLNRSKLKKSQKLKQKAMTVPAVPSSITTRPDFSQHGPEWLINEDWALLQAVNTLFELPLDFQNETVHNKLANWEMAADVVNSTSKIRRSARQCRDRYQNVLLPREEGKLMVATSETNDVKIKKNKKQQQQQQQTTVVTSQPQPKTSIQFNSDHGKGCLNMHFNKFESVRKAAAKRKPIVKQTNSGKFQTSSNRHAQILAANGISVDKTLNPRELATLRADRIAKDKAQAVVAAQQLQQHQSTTASSQQQTTTISGIQGTIVSNNVQVVSVSKGSVGIVQQVTTSQPAKGNIGASTLVVNPSGGGTSSSVSGLTTTAATFAAINRKMQNVGHVPITQVPSATLSGGRILGQTTTQIIPGISQQSKASTIQQQQQTLTVAVTCVGSSIVGANLLAQVQRGTTTVANVGATNNAGLVTTEPFKMNPRQFAILRQKAQKQQHQIKIQQQQQQRMQQKKFVQQQTNQTTLAQQQQALQQAVQQTQGQPSKQTQPTVVASVNQISNLSLQAIKTPVTVRGTSHQIQSLSTATPQQQQQLLQLKKPSFQVLHHRGGITAATSQIQQMLASQKITPQQLQQLHQQQRHTQLQQQQQLKFQQTSGAMVSQQPKLVMTQVKTGQGNTTQKTQQIQLQQIQQSVPGSLPQQILLRPSLTGNGPNIQGLSQQIQLRAMISQQSNLPRVTGAQLQSIPAQVNLQTVVMQPQQQQQAQTQQQQAAITSSVTTNQQLQSQQTTQVQVVSSLAQYQKCNIQAAVQKQIQQQQQQQMKVQSVTITSAVLTKPSQASHIQRQQVLSATPAQLSKVKAFVAKAELQASLSRANTPLNNNQKSTATTGQTVSAGNLQTGTIQLQSGQQVNIRAQQIKQQHQQQVKSNDAASNPASLLLKHQQIKIQQATTAQQKQLLQQHQLQQQQQQQLQQQLQKQQAQKQAAQQQAAAQQQQQAAAQQQQQEQKQINRQATFTVDASSTAATQAQELNKDGGHVASQVEVLGAETELSTEETTSESSELTSVQHGMRTRTRSHKSN